MSGLEIFGALATASQLAEQSLKIISLISHLYKTIRDAPETLRSRVEQVKQLLDIARLIERNASLQTDPVLFILRSCEHEAENLLGTLRKVLAVAGDGKGKKLWKAIVGITKEKNILEHLGKLEQQKSSLALCIASIDAALLYTVQENVTSIIDTLPEIAGGIRDIHSNIARNVLSVHEELTSITVKVTALHDVLPAMEQAMQQLSMNDHVSKLPQEPEMHSRKYYRVPNRRVHGFIGRVDIINRIDHELSSGPAPRIVVLRGMGGQGKTQIALEYCHRAKDKKFSAIFWVDATSEGSLKKSFEVISEDIRPAAMALTSTESRVDFVMASLSAWPSPWLMVFDNHDDPSAFANLQDFLPCSEHSSILITTRHADVDALGRAIKLPGLPEKDALELLFRQSVPNDLDIAHGKIIVERLGYHPLAIAQASAYIIKRGIGLKDFMGHYNRRRKFILEQTPQMSQYRRRLNDADKETSLSVFTTWELSFQQLETMQANLLTLSAFFNCKDISERLFNEPYINRNPNDRLPSCLGSLFDIFQGSWDRDKFLDILSELRDLSLLQNFSEEADGFQHFSLHPLVKDWIRLRTEKGVCREYSLLATEMLAKLIIPSWRNHQFEMSLLGKQEVLSHIDIHMENYHDFLEIGMATTFIKSQLIKFTDSEYWFESFYSKTGRYKEAEVVNRRVIELREKVLGPEHPDTLTSMNNLAFVLDNQGKYEEAEGMNRRVVELSKKVLGPEHPQTLTSMGNLALVLSRQGKYKEAEGMNRRVMELHEKVLGPEHPDMLTSMSNLALVLNNQGKYEEAEEMNRHAMELYEKVLGPEHPSTLTSMSNLAGVLDSHGKYEEAEEMNRRVIKLKEKVLGPEHPDTLASMINLATVLISQGKYKEARDMNRCVIELQEAVLGPEHPDTLRSKSNLALGLGRLGRYKESEDMARRVIELRKRVLGPEHPWTLVSMSNLGSVLENQGKYKEAEAINICVVRLREAVLGPQHPYTLISMINLAAVLIRQGKYNEAKEMNMRVIELQETALGPEHPDILITKSNLAIVLGRLGRYKESEDMARRVIELRKTALGPEHPKTLVSMGNLAVVLENQGKYKEAEDMNICVVRLREAALGPQHPFTLRSISHLALVLSRQGRYKEGEEMARRVVKLQEMVIGPEHPDTLTSMSNLAVALQRQGKYEEAESMNRHLVDIRATVLGLEHPDTLKSVKSLASLLESQKEYESASIYYQRALSGYKKALGLEHPDTIACSQHYSSMLEEMDRQRNIS